LKRSLWEAASSTFEQVVFLFPEPEPSEAACLAPVEAAAHISFHGPFTGTLLLKVAGGVLPTLAANMLGEEEPPAEWLQLDALGEIANIILGGVLPLIAPEQSFEQTPPAFQTGTVTTTEAISAPAATTRVGLEHGRAELLLFLERRSGRGQR
jgi:CheY-specific phosphatase CheX